SSAPITVAGGSTLTVTVQNGPGNQWDCVSLNASPNVNAAWLSDAFLTPFSTSDPMTLSMPSTAGTNGVLFWQNCNTWIMTGPPVTVQQRRFPYTTLLRSSSAPITVAGGSTLTVTVQNGPGNQWDCVSLNASPNVNAAWL